MSRKETNFSGQRLSEENKKKLMKKMDLAGDIIEESQSGCLSMIVIFNVSSTKYKCLKI